MMLLFTQISAVLGGVLIASCSFSAVVLHESTHTNKPVSPAYFQAVIDTNTGDFITPSIADENRVIKRNNIASKRENEQYNKKLSTVEGGGVIINMNINSFSQMYATKDQKRTLQAQCSPTQ